MVRKNYVLGVDLGGTKVLAAVVNRKGEVIARSKKKTKAQRSSEEILDRIAQVCQDAVEEAGLEMDAIKAVGIGAPGPLDPVKGCILETPNLNLTGAPIGPYLTEHLGIPAYLDNDVNVGTFGEFMFGAGKDKNDVIGIFLGTGVGGGIVVNGKLINGSSLNAGEIGHMKIHANGDKCGCGQKGCLEAYASKTAMLSRLKKAIEDKKQKSVLPDILPKGDWNRMTSKIFVKAVEEKDKLVIKELKRAAANTGIAVGSLLNLLSPEMVIIGGGLTEALEDFFIPIIKDQAKKNCFSIMYENTEIVPAALGDDAGILGAAAIAWERSKR